ncbi:SubName: Full=Uncharacterized protein {ECO:0000313/EMBL:CCA76994.1} [Serendipita indica DSM 11827]|nr:SubName: Full=Uncharacterized protein {ECO:0000313/EMBL:CCA76994.1} [Serendipita indica DSM 11827]
MSPLVRRPSLPILGAVRFTNAEDESAPDPTNTRKRRRTSHPAPYQITSYEPKQRILLRAAKATYALRIAMVNAYPTPAERMDGARAAFDVAEGEFHLPGQDRRSIEWSPNKYRLITDAAWPIRSRVKATAAALVSVVYCFEMPQRLVDLWNGPVTTADHTRYIWERVAYLLENGHYLRGSFGRRTSMLYAHPILQQIIKQSLYRPANADQRVHFSPMPAGAIALAATATFSALEEWKTGLRQKIPFTEESYRRTYAMHLRNIKCMIDTIPDQAASLMMSMADYCIACNQAPAPLPSENQDELNELDFFGLDNNITDVDKDNASLKIFDAYDQ